MRPDPKPAKRVKATADQWVQLRKQKLGPCRCCGENMLAVFPAYPWNQSGLESSLHHVVPKSLGGDDLAENLAPLCGDGTRGCHGLVEARDPWACSLLGLRLTGTERDYVLAKKGADFLARYYGVKEVAA
jgi:hypothetical protein